jgi:hypothetical protein
VAQALLDKWQIGESSYFCDEIDWDAASAQEIMEVIWNTYQSAQES